MTTANDSQPRCHVEIINKNFPRHPFEAAVYDFDGTLSLLRCNWQDVMIPMMVEILSALGSQETPDALYAIVEEYVMRLTGKQTIYQMIQLTEEITKRGGTPLDPLDYKHQYHDLLWAQIGHRIEAVRSGSVDPETMTVPESKALLTAVADRGITQYLASGTDLKYVRDELTVLQLHEFFEPRVYGALDDYENFSKALVIERIIHETNVPGDRIIGFGDGYVEIEEIKKVGGLAIGVASDEDRRTGINAWKRTRLIEAGADIIIADYRCLNELLGVIGG